VGVGGKKRRRQEKEVGYRAWAEAGLWIFQAARGGVKAIAGDGERRWLCGGAAGRRCYGWERGAGGTMSANRIWSSRASPDEKVR